MSESSPRHGHVRPMSNDDNDEDVAPFDDESLGNTAASLDLTSMKMFLESVTPNATMPAARMTMALDFNDTTRSEHQAPSNPLEALSTEDGSPNPRAADFSHLRPSAAVGRSRSQPKEEAEQQRTQSSNPSNEVSPGFTAEGDWEDVPFDLDAAAAATADTSVGLGDGFLQGLFAKRASVALHNGVIHRPSFLEPEPTLVKHASVLNGAGSFARFFRRFSSTQHESRPESSSHGGSDPRASSRAASSAAGDDDAQDDEDEDNNMEDLVLQARLNGIVMGEWRSRLGIEAEAYLTHEYLCEASASTQRDELVERDALQQSLRNSMHQSAAYRMLVVETAETAARQIHLRQQAHDWITALCEPWRREAVGKAGFMGLHILLQFEMLGREEVARKRLAKSHTKAVTHFVKIRDFLLELHTSTTSQLTLITTQQDAQRQEISSQRLLQCNMYSLINLCYRQHLHIRASEERDRIALRVALLPTQEAVARLRVRKARSDFFAELQEDERTAWKTTVARLGERQIRASLQQLEERLEPQGRSAIEGDQQNARIKLLKSYKTKKPKPLRLDVMLERSEAQLRTALTVEYQEELDNVAREYQLYTAPLRELEQQRHDLVDTDEPRERSSVLKADREQRRFLFTLYQLEDRQQTRRERISSAAARDFETRIAAWRSAAAWFDAQPESFKIRWRELAGGLEKSEATQRKYLVNTEAAARDAIVLPFLEATSAAPVDNFTTPQRKKSSRLPSTSITPAQSNSTSPANAFTGPSPPPGSPTRPLTRQTPSTLRSRWERVLKDLDAVDERFEHSDEMSTPALAELVHQREDARRASRDARRHSGGASARAASFSIGRPSDRRASGVGGDTASPAAFHRPQPPSGHSPGISPRIIARPDASPKLPSRTGSFTLASTARPPAHHRGSNAGIPPQSPKQPHNSTAGAVNTLSATSRRESFTRR